MARFVVSLFLLAATALATQSPPRALTGPSTTSVDPAFLSAVTFNKDVFPILQRNCQVCHRPGEAAPMSLLTFKEARPWARSIKEKVVNRVMPPWHADPRFGRFANDPSLSDAECKTIADWVAAGAPLGAAKDPVPAPPRKAKPGDKPSSMR